MSFTATRLAALAVEFETEASRRRAMSAHDVTADVLEYCAGKLMSALTEASTDDEELSPAEFGAQARVNKSASQVRRWCQADAIECRRVGRDYRIRRGAALPTFLARVA